MKTQAKQPSSNGRLRLRIIASSIALVMTVMCAAENTGIWGMGDNVVYAIATEAPTQKVIKKITEKVTLKFKTVKKKNSHLLEGKKKVLKSGKNGKATVTYQETYENGVLTAKTEVKRVVKKKAVNKVISVGTAKIKKVNRGGEKRPLVYLMEATAYTGNGNTASGKRAKEGLVAVDPRVIPLGTKLYIETADGYSAYGYAVASDTGGAIKGNKIDLYFDSRGECVKFGRRNVRVYVLK